MLGVDDALIVNTVGVVVDVTTWFELNSLLSEDVAVAIEFEYPRLNVTVSPSVLLTAVTFRNVDVALKVKMPSFSDAVGYSMMN